MVNYYDISKWEEHEYFNTGGTRDKVIVENPSDGKLYYFKTSLKKKQIDYTYEFWSEVIASEIGKFLGFDMLHYDVAWNNGRLGCLSMSMIDARFAELQEGYKWLTGFDSTYDVKNKEAYTFQLILKMMNKRFQNKKFTENIIKIIVFDSIIGNEDRHQENWGIIVAMQTSAKTSFFKKTKNESVEPSYLFAPIYDSGSSLGRELNDQKVEQILKDKIQLEAYINRGKSEIHWEGEKGKLKHFDLIKRISDNGFQDTILEIIKTLQVKYRESDIADIINGIDNCLPPECLSLKIPQCRKKFLIKLVSLRIQKLFDLFL